MKSLDKIPTHQPTPEPAAEPTPEVATEPTEATPTKHKKFKLKLQHNYPLPPSYLKNEIKLEI